MAVGIEKLISLLKDKDKEIDDLKNKVESLEQEVYDYDYGYEDSSYEIYNLEQEISDLKKRDVYPRREITLPELMKFEFLKENWDKISLENLEDLVNVR